MNGVVTCTLPIGDEVVVHIIFVLCFFFHAEGGIRGLVRSRGLGDVYKRQVGARRPRLPALRGLPGEDEPGDPGLRLRPAGVGRRGEGGRAGRPPPSISGGTRALSLIHI